MNPLSNPELVAHLKQSVAFVVPEAVLAGVACALFAAAAFRPSRGFAVALALVGVAAAAVVACVAPDPSGSLTRLAYSPVDPFGPAAYVRWFALAGGVLYVLLGWSEARRETAAEYYGCLLTMVAGLSLVGRANDLTTLFLSLEMISIPTYVLLYLPTTTKAGQEAAMKYFMLSVAASAVLLFGFSYLFGLVGSANLTVVTSALASASAGGGSPLAAVAMVLVLGGLGFRIAAVPFHFYAPDVYEGGPTGVVAQLATVPKIAGLVALARLLGLLDPHAGLPFDAAHSLVPLVLWVIAAVTMSFGNLMALVQDNLKRLFAFSGVAHTGYMLIGIVAAGAATSGDPATSPGWAAVLFYLAAYGLMTVGALAVFSALSTPERPVETVDDLAGLGRSHPLSAGLLTVFLLSLIGIPLTAGFVGKFFLFAAAYRAPTDTPLQYLPRILVVIAAVNAAVGAVYYLRVIGVMFLRSPLRPEAVRPAIPQTIVAVICAVCTLLFGCWPLPLQIASNTASTPESVAVPQLPLAP